MLKRELQKEGWISFEDDLDGEIDEEEVNMLVEDAYKNICKLGRLKEINQKLLERYKHLDRRTHKVYDIQNISIIRNCKLSNLEKDLNDSLLIIESKAKSRVILSLRDGIEYSFKYRTEIILMEGKSKIEVIYDKQDDDFQEQLELGYIKKVTFYKDRELINKHTNESVSFPYILEIVDIFNQTIYVDIVFNKIFTRQNNYYLEKPKREKYFIIYEKGKSNKIPKKLMGTFEMKFNKHLISFE